VLSLDTEERQTNLPGISRKLIAGERLTDWVSRVDMLRVGWKDEGIAHMRWVPKYTIHARRNDRRACCVRATLCYWSACSGP
jgi:hypothetical protein